MGTKAKDALIEQLLKKVEEKKKQIEKIRNPVFKTNLSFSFGSVDSTARLNLNVAPEESLFTVLMHLDHMINHQESINETYGLTSLKLWNGYPLEDWRDDVVLKLKQKQSQIQVSELKAIEAKLNNLISEDAKKDRELEALKNLLDD